MGCDIHGVLEVKDEGSGRWIGLHDFMSLDGEAYDFFWRDASPKVTHPKRWAAYAKMMRRNYELFASLAGVRGHGPEPRGIPPDASELTLFHTTRWGEDAHSHSYGTIRELGVAVLSHLAPETMLNSEKRGQWLANAFCTGMYISETNTDQSWMDKFRLVFWFDN